MSSITTQYGVQNENEFAEDKEQENENRNRPWENGYVERKAQEFQERLGRERERRHNIKRWNNFIANALGTEQTPKQEEFKKGDYVAVLNDPTTVGGLGHNAILIGNEQTGWEYRSKDGREGESNSSNNEVVGGPAKQGTDQFKTINDFLLNPDYKNYTEGIVYKIPGKNGKENALKVMDEQIGSRYIAAISNCAHAVNFTLNSIGINTMPSNLRNLSVNFCPDIRQADFNFLWVGYLFF
jgi:hypothetical protein